MTPDEEHHDDDDDDPPATCANHGRFRSVGSRDAQHEPRREDKYELTPEGRALLDQLDVDRIR